LDPAFNESVLPRQVSLQSNQKLWKTKKK
jgi:hypothetical protein